MRRVGNVEIDDVGREAHRRHLAVRADVRGAVEARPDGRQRLAVLLPGLRPHAGELRLRRIADVEDDEFVAVAVIAGREGGEIGVFAARIGVAVRAAFGAPPLADLLRILGIADVPDDQRWVGGRFLVDRGDQNVVVQRQLRGQHLFLRRLVGDELDVTRILRVGDIDDAPALIERMPGVEIPVIVLGVLDRELEGAGLAVEPGETDELEIGGHPAGRSRIGARRQRRAHPPCRGGAERRRRRPQNPLEHDRRRHSRSLRWRTISGIDL